MEGERFKEGFMREVPVQLVFNQIKFITSFLKDKYDLPDIIGINLG